MSEHRPIYTTADEVAFLVNLAADRPAAGVRYCRMILTKPRQWDEGVDAAKVKSAARRVLEETLLKLGGDL